MHIFKNIIIPGADNKPIALDIFYAANAEKMPVVIYAHGFNGFKDWANFDIIARRFAEKGFVFVKFNFSHNGTAPATPEEFTDPEAFGNNNYSKQLIDLNNVIDWVCDPDNENQNIIDVNNICLIGHSMGGGISILHAAGDKRIKKLVTWAGISECKTPWGSWSAEKMQAWKETGVQYYLNGRTKQQMPLYYQLHEDYLQNYERLDIEAAIKRMQIPVLICHGTSDTAVPIERANDMVLWQPNAVLFPTASDHVFGRSHPWVSAELPRAMEEVLQESIKFVASDKA